MQGQSSPPKVFRSLGNYLQDDTPEHPSLQLIVRQLRGIPVRYTFREIFRRLFHRTEPLFLKCMHI